MGRYRMQYWWCRKNSLGGIVGHGKYCNNVEEIDRGVVTLVVDLAKASNKCQPKVV